MSQVDPTFSIEEQLHEGVPIALGRDDYKIGCIMTLNGSCIFLLHIIFLPCMDLAACIGLVCPTNVVIILNNAVN